jgi:hypothetical protein
MANPASAPKRLLVPFTSFSANEKLPDGNLPAPISG